jgi:hypothetical protein
LVVTGADFRAIQADDVADLLLSPVDLLDGPDLHHGDR